MALTIPVSEIVANSSNRLLGKHESWGRVLLGNIATVLNGFAFKSSEFSSSGGVPLIRIRDVGKEQSETTYLGEYDPRYVVEPGDLLVGMDGDFNCARWRGPRGLLNQRVCKIALKSDLYIPKFLDYTLPGYLKAINDVTSSVTVKHLSSKTIEEIPLPLPPIEVQQRLVAEIEKQFSRLDEAVATLKRVKANLKRYKAAVLKAAVEGKLTEDWRKQHSDVEPASKLLERILAERRAKWSGKGKYNEPAIPGSANLLPPPTGWCWVTLDQTLWQLRSGTAETSKREPTEYPVLKSSAVRQGRIDLSDLNYLQKLQSMRPENFLKLGDFLITRLSGSVDYVGCSAVVKSSICEGIQYPDRIFCGKLLTGVDGTYLSYCFQHPRIRKILEGAAKSTAGHQRISMSDLYPLTLPLPPTAEQVRIVAEVERRLSVIEELETAVEANLTRADRLRQAILQRAFCGELHIEKKSHV